MNLDDIPLFSMLKSRLAYLTERQRLTAENVANADTPGYAPRDLKPFTLPTGFGGVGAPGQPLAPTQTDAAHMSFAVSGSGLVASQQWTPQSGADSETRLDGNKVVLEDEMMKMTDARMNYDTAIGFYEKSMAMLQTALRTPGKGA